MFEKIIQHTLTPERPAGSGSIDPGMNDRIRRLRKLSVETEPSLSIERALHETVFYQENFGKMSIPVLRASNFLDHCKRKAIYIGADELIVDCGRHSGLDPESPDYIGDAETSSA